MILQVGDVLEVYDSFDLIPDISNGDKATVISIDEYMVTLRFNKKMILANGEISEYITRHIFNMEQNYRKIELKPNERSSLRAIL